jgi:DUF4097 and DUF4098 domain-containing protein YvlB
MKSLGIAASRLLLVLALASSARARERDITREYPALSGCAVQLDTYRGDVEVKPASGAQIRVEVHLDVAIPDDRKADRLLDRLQLDLKQEDNLVTVFARNPHEMGLRFVWQDRERIRIDYTIAVPAGCAVRIVTADGEILISDVTARIHARTARGGIVCKRIHGDLDASSGSGDLIVSHCDGAAVLETGRGEIRAGTIAGPAQVRVVNGDIEIQHAQGGISAFAEAGSITVGVGPELSRASSLVTDGGAITVRLDGATRCTVDASSVWGRVHTKLPFAVQSGGDGKKLLIGRLNGGGPGLKIHADGGQVQIDPARI